MFSSDEPRDVGLTRRSWLRLVAAGAAFTAYSAPAWADTRSLLPPGRVSKDPGLEALLGSMRSIVRRRDTAALCGLMTADFKVEFDVGKGPMMFRQHWKPESPNSTIWPVLGRLLSLDGTFYSDSLFALPYVYTRFPIDLDRLQYVVTTGQAAVHTTPSPTAPRLGVLTHAIVSLSTPLTPPAMLSQIPFLAVQHPDRGTCYVAGADVYSPAGHRAFFEKGQGRWRWISLAAPTLATPPVLRESGA